jgi:hypothetical protein
MRPGGRRAVVRVLVAAATVALVGTGIVIWADIGARGGDGATVAAAVDPAAQTAAVGDPLSISSVSPTGPTISSTTSPTSSTSSTSSTTVPPATTTTVVHVPTTTSATATKAAPAGSRSVTFVNSVRQTIWLAGWQQTPTPALTTSGWVLPAGQQLTITVPDHLNGRFWGRTGCTFDASGHGHCTTGDCGGVFQCKGYGAIPATLAEYNLNAWDGMDFYDVSMVDGSNLPMYINITHGATPDKISSTGCVAAGCTTSVACPSALVVDGGAACSSACAKLGGDQYCCQGAWSARSACDPTQWQPEDYAAVFKKAEPYAYSYVDDDATSTFTCSGECDYRITFGTTP